MPKVVGVVSFSVAHLAIYAALLLHGASCKLLLVELEDDGGGGIAGAQLGSPSVAQRSRRTMQGEEFKI